LIGLNIDMLEPVRGRDRYSSFYTAIA